MGVDEIITLENGKEYVLLLATMQDNQKYFLASEMLNNESTENYKLFKELIINNEFSVEEIIDEKLQEKLIADFEAQYEAEVDNENQE